MTNTGLAPLHLTSAVITGDAAGDYSVTPSGSATVAPWATLTLTVTCTPTAIGIRAARLDFDDDATGERRVTLGCVGR